MTTKKKTRIEISCDGCSKSIAVVPSKIRYHKTHFCSFRCRVRFGPYLSGRKNHRWKGNKVGYRGIHHWVDRTLGKPSFCEFCKISQPPKGKGIKRSYFQWANISGEYKRDLKDWKRLCYLCHKTYDSKKKEACDPE